MAEAARRLSYQDYLTLEQEQDLRHEFLDGEAWAMAGGTPRHAGVIGNLYGLTWSALRGRPCLPYGSDLKIHVEDTGLFTYPDLAVVCGPLARSATDPNAVTNPVLLAEVLSPSTESWDRGGKFAHYRRIPTVQHVLLVSVDSAKVELYTRMADGRWLLSEHGPGEQVALPALDLSFAVDELYAGLPEDAPAAS